MPLQLVRAENGDLMQVIRCDRPKRAVALAREAAARNDAALMDRIPEIIEKEGGRYRFVGYLGRDTRSARSAVCDEQGKEIGRLEPGDSFVSGLRPSLAESAIAAVGSGKGQ